MDRRKSTFTDRLPHMLSDSSRRTFTFIFGVCQLHEHKEHAISCGWGDEEVEMHDEDQRGEKTTVKILDVMTSSQKEIASRSRPSWYFTSTSCIHREEESLSDSARKSWISTMEIFLSPSQIRRFLQIDGSSVSTVFDLKENIELLKYYLFRSSFLMIILRNYGDDTLSRSDENIILSLRIWIPDSNTEIIRYDAIRINENTVFFKNRSAQSISWMRWYIKNKKKTINRWSHRETLSIR